MLQPVFAQIRLCLTPNWTFKYDYELRTHITPHHIIITGEVFVIRHDVNLHTEILDTPDFFW